jgi:hypothetical protein
VRAPVRGRAGLRAVLWSVPGGFGSDGLTRVLSPWSAGRVAAGRACLSDAAGCTINESACKSGFLQFYYHGPAGCWGGEQVWWQKLAPGWLAAVGDTPPDQVVILQCTHCAAFVLTDYTVCNDSKDGPGPGQPSKKQHPGHPSAVRCNIARYATAEYLRLAATKLAVSSSACHMCSGDSWCSGAERCLVGG